MARRPKFFAVTDLTAYLPEEERIKHVAISNFHTAAFVGIFSHPTETYVRFYVFGNGGCI